MKMYAKVSAVVNIIGPTLMAAKTRGKTAAGTTSTLTAVDRTRP